MAHAGWRNRSSCRSSASAAASALGKRSSGRFASSRSEQRLQAIETRGELGHRLLAMFVNEPHRALGPIRLAAGQHLEKDDAEAVEVAARIGGLAVSLLRAHVVRCAEDQAALREIQPLGRILRQSEIDQGDASVLPQHDVAGLQIAMHHAISVQRGQCPRDRRGDAARPNAARPATSCAGAGRRAENTPSPARRDGR